VQYCTSHRRGWTLVASSVPNSQPHTHTHTHTYTYTHIHIHTHTRTHKYTHLLFLPAMPPITVSGMVTRPHMMTMMTMVPNGSAAVDCKAIEIQARDDKLSPKHMATTLPSTVQQLTVRTTLLRRRKVVLVHCYEGDVATIVTMMALGEVWTVLVRMAMTPVWPHVIQPDTKQCLDVCMYACVCASVKSHDLGLAQVYVCINLSYFAPCQH